MRGMGEERKCRGKLSHLKGTTASCFHVGMRGPIWRIIQFVKSSHKSRNFYDKFSDFKILTFNWVLKMQPNIACIDLLAVLGMCRFILWLYLQMMLPVSATPSLLLPQNLAKLDYLKCQVSLSWPQDRQLS